jgi:hypothetical protein
MFCDYKLLVEAFLLVDTKEITVQIRFTGGNGGSDSTYAQAHHQRPD